MEKDNGKSIEEIGLLEKRIAELKNVKELSENIMDAVREPLVIMDANLKISLVNKSFYSIFKVGGRPGVSGQTITRNTLSVNCLGKRQIGAVLRGRHRRGAGKAYQRRDRDRECEGKRNPAR